MAAGRQEDVNDIAANDTGVAEVGRELDSWIQHTALDFRGEFLALLDSCAEQTDFCFQGCQSFVVVGVVFCCEGRRCGWGWEDGFV